jgi:hypothetical protein
MLNEVKHLSEYSPPSHCDGEEMFLYAQHEWPLAIGDFINANQSWTYCSLYRSAILYL